MTVLRVNSVCLRRYCATITLAVLFAVVLFTGPARAAFHLAVIDEIMTSYDDDPSVQFVEILMLNGGQQFVTGTVLSAFDDSGSFMQAVFTVTGNVSSGADRPWIMATDAWESLSGVTPDFVIPAGLPDSGMVCWGKPQDQAVPNQYVDCIAYGAYAGPTNVHIGTPTPLDAIGHSLVRLSETHDSFTDFVCADPAGPTNNASETFSMAATVACSTATTTSTTTTSSSTTSSVTTTTTLPPEVCGDPISDALRAQGGRDSGQGRPELVTASDALFILNAAVGVVSCQLCLCDVDDSGAVTAVDALATLQSAVGVDIELTCPACDEL